MSLLLPHGSTAASPPPVPAPPGDARIPGLPQGKTSPLRATYVDVAVSFPGGTRPDGLPAGTLGRVGAWDGSRKTTVFVDARAARALAGALDALAGYLETKP